VLERVGGCWVVSMLGQVEVAVVFDAARGRFEEERGEVFVKHGGGVLVLPWL